MTIQECYEELGGDYKEVVTRLMNEKLVRKFIARFLDDTSYEQLCAAVRQGQREDAFRAAHTLKGVCQNLGFGKLLSSTEVLTELLCPEAEKMPEEAEELLKAVSRDYEETSGIIRAFLAEAE